MEIVELQDKDRAAWDEYVSVAPYSVIFHLSGWKNVMEDTFGLQTHFLYARERGEIVGVLPLLQVKSRLSGYFFTSLPGGLCAQDEGIAHALIEHSEKKVRSHSARFLILRDSYQKWDLPDLVTNAHHCTVVANLSDNPDFIWQNINKTVRQNVKKAMKAGLEVRIGLDLLDDYYPVYSSCLREKGTPTQGLRFFKEVISSFPSSFNIIALLFNNQVIGGGFVACFKDTIYNTWGGVLREYYPLRSNYLLYWGLLKFGCEQGYQRVDMGRCVLNSGNYQFKRQWLGEPQPLYQQFFLNGIRELPAVGGGWEDDLKYRLFFEVWKNLPLSAAEFIGPRLRKRMPFG
jgi:serine/alanine adding enzyme